MFQIEVTDEFSAAHFLKLYDGTYEPRHGHLFKVAVLAESEKLDSMGVVIDFEVLKPALKKVLSEFEFGSFNDHPDFKNDKLNPSTENIAKIIYDRLAQKLKDDSSKITKVTVWETPDASASFVPA